MYLARSSQGWGGATLKPGPVSTRGAMGATFFDRPPVTAPRYVFRPPFTVVRQPVQPFAFHAATPAAVDPAHREVEVDASVATGDVADAPRSLVVERTAPASA